MRKIILTLGVIALFGCNKDKATERINEEKYSTVTLKEQIKVKSKTEEGKFDFLDVTFSAKVDKDGNLIEGEVSRNLLDYFGVKTQEEFEDQIRQKIQEKQLSYFKASTEKQIDNTDFYAEDGGWSHAKCITECYDHFRNNDGSKREGRGSCKLGCWVDTIRNIVCDCVKNNIKEVKDALLPSDSQTTPQD